MQFLHRTLIHKLPNKGVRARQEAPNRVGTMA